MSAAPQPAVPASFPTHEFHTGIPGAQPTLGVVSAAFGVSRAPGFSLDARLAAICARYERRPFFWWQAELPRYRRLRSMLREVYKTFPMRRTRRLGSSLRLELQRDLDSHRAALDALDLRYCAGPCAICDFNAPLDAQERAYTYERETRMLGGAR